MEGKGVDQRRKEKGEVSMSSRVNEEMNSERMKRGRKGRREREERRGGGNSFNEHAAVNDGDVKE